VHDIVVADGIAWAALNNLHKTRVALLQANTAKVRASDGVGTPLIHR
jgi:hypothetical protein